MFDIVPWRKNNSIQSKGDEFQNMVNSFFNDDFFNSVSIIKNNFSVDLKEDDNNYIIEADLPGVDKKDIDISYNNRYLKIIQNFPLILKYIDFYSDKFHIFLLIICKRFKFEGFICH